jgi:O-methyltransferase involved in polyketide biosynthesis
MSETASHTLSGVPETSLAALYWRAMESQRPDALIKDEKAEALVAQLDYDFDRIRQIPMPELLYVMRTMLTREMDRYARGFLGGHPDGVVVHIGCGLDTRFERADNGQVEWYDLDLPDVIDLRRELIGDEGGRYHLLACSVFEDVWLDAVKVHSPRPFLFLAETVFVYFTEAQVKSLVRMLRDQLPGGVGLRRLAAIRGLAGQPLLFCIQLPVCGPHAVGLLAWPGDRRLERRHPPARRVGLLRPA